MTCTTSTPQMWRRLSWPRHAACTSLQQASKRSCQHQKHREATVRGMRRCTAPFPLFPAQACAECSTPSALMNRMRCFLRIGSTMRFKAVAVVTKLHVRDGEQTYVAAKWASSMRRRASSPRHAAWMDTAALMRTSKPSRCSTMRHHACSFKAAVWEGQHAYGGNQRARLQSDESTSNTKKHEPYTTVRYQRDSEGNVCVSGRPTQACAQSLYLHLCKSLPGTNAPPQRLDQGGGCAVHVEVRLARKHAPGGLNDRCSEIPDLVAQEGQSAGNHAWSR